MSESATRDAPTPHGWDQSSLVNPHAQADKAARVEAMFDAIAPSYERFNTVATFGRDTAWRRLAVAAAGVRPSDIVLDVACGTGDMIRAFAAAAPAPARIIGLDFAAKMLECGHYAGNAVPVQLIRGDALALPLADESVDVISCAFGVRNFQDLQGGLRQMARILRPGGRVVILEFATPAGRLRRWAYNAYCNVVLPRLGGWLARDSLGAYRYLPKSIQTFDTPAAMLRRLEETGLRKATATSMNLGGVVLYRAEKPA